MTTTPDPWGDRPLDDEITVGPWRLLLRTAEIADLTYRDTPVLRAVRFVTRDHDWRTADDVVLDRAVDGHDDRARVTISAASSIDGHELLRYRLSLDVDGDTVRVEAVATVGERFRRNRVGLVVLHPPTLAGAPLTIVHPDGATEQGAYPLWIAPHQPAVDVAGYSWTSDGVAVDVALSGDVFEMEDQRNWTDASFKTYSTPLAEPFPVTLDAGTEIRQAMTLHCTPVATDETSGRDRTGGPAPLRASVPPVVDAPPAPGAGTPPVLQLLAASAPAADRPDDEALLTGLPVLVEPVLDHPDVAAVLASARRDARGGPLDVRFVTDDPDALRRAVDAALAAGPVVRIGAATPDTHVTTPALQRALRDAAAGVPGLEVVAGTRAHFTELNRTIALFDDWDGPLTFSVTAQMHDRSRAQVTESLRMQRWVVRSASRLAAGRPLHVGPVTLRPRFNAVATSPRAVVTDPTARDGYGPQHVPDATDPAQHSTGAGLWTAAAIAALTVPGVASITLAETWGPRGVVTSDGRRSPAADAIDWLR